MANSAGQTCQITRKASNIHKNLFHGPDVFNRFRVKMSNGAEHPSRAHRYIYTRINTTITTAGSKMRWKIGNFDGWVYKYRLSLRTQVCSAHLEASKFFDYSSTIFLKYSCIAHSIHQNWQNTVICDDFPVPATNTTRYCS